MTLTGRPVRHEGYLKSLYRGHVMRNPVRRRLGQGRLHRRGGVHRRPRDPTSISRVLTTGVPCNNLGSGYFDRRTDLTVRHNGSSPASKPSAGTSPWKLAPAGITP